MMKQTENTKGKKIAIIVALAVVGILVGVGSFYIYQRVSKTSPAPEEAPIAQQAYGQLVIKEIPIPKAMQTIPYQYITSDNVHDLFENENIIPIRFTKTLIEEKEPKKESFFKRAINRIFGRKQVKEVEPSFTDEEKTVQIENSRIISKGYERKLIKETNLNKSLEKQSLINDIRNAVFEAIEVLPMEHVSSSSDEMLSLFWTTVFINGDGLFDWMLNNCTVEELQNYKNSVTEVLIDNQPAEARAQLFVAVENIVREVTSKLSLGEVRERRIQLCKMLGDYKKSQPMIGIAEESYETEKLLFMIDLLSNFIHVLPDAHVRIHNTLSALEKTISNLSECAEQKMLGEYMYYVKEHNENLLEEINGFMRFIADLEQYIAVNTFKIENSSEDVKIKNIKAKNAGSFVYDIKPGTSGDQAIREVAKALDLYVSLLPDYLYLLSITEENGSQKYGYPIVETTATETLTQETLEVVDSE